MKKQKLVIIFFGMIAAGKSYLASQWAERHGFPYYNSDVIRKELAEIKPNVYLGEEIDKGIYSPEFSRKTYDELLNRAQKDVSNPDHDGVVLDGSYQFRDERDRVRAQFEDSRLIFIYCWCDETVMKSRMEERKKDPKAVSDGHWEVYLKQKQRFELPTELSREMLVTIDTDNDLEKLILLLDDSIMK